VTPVVWHWHGARVPWIAPWSREAPGDPPITRRGSGCTGIAYRDEHYSDRHEDVLWVRTPLAPGCGDPRFAKVHALRQRQAIDRMLCQVCGGRTIGERTDGRWLIIMHSRTGRPIKDGERTAVPPIHEACAREALRSCPHLMKGSTAALVEYAPDWGVAGILYDPKTLAALPPAKGGQSLDYVPYEDDEGLAWTLAARAVVALYGVEPIDVLELGGGRIRPLPARRRSRQ
jgi:hypothetical protein